MDHKASLIISVYNGVRQLELIFTALKIQTFKDFEVIVSDDGSGDEMKKLVSEMKINSGLSVKHVWHEDKGFRKNEILNKSIKTAATPYLIFFDGDCIPHSNFVNAHYENRKENKVLCGRRVHLSKDISDSLTPDDILTKKYERSLGKHFITSMQKGDRQTVNAEEGMHIKNSILRKAVLTEKISILGSNFSLHKSLMEKINGFDENYIGAGVGEDSDIEYRLLLTGAKLKSVRNLAIQYHLYHKNTTESKANLGYLEEVKRKKEFYCENGLVKK